MLVHAADIGSEALEIEGRLEFPPSGVYPSLTLAPPWICQGFRQVVNATIFREFAITDRAMSWHAYPEAHDSWTCLMASISGTVVVIPDRLAIYRRHGKNTTDPPLTASSGFLSKLSQRLGSHAGHYWSVARVMGEISAYLAKRAESAASLDSSEVLGRAARELDTRSQRLALRGVVQGGASAKERLRAYGKLLRSGGYSRGAPSELSWNAAVKDFVIALLPVSRGDRVFAGELVR
jgi:hypothetical protein